VAAKFGWKFNKINWFTVDFFIPLAYISILWYTVFTDRCTRSLTANKPYLFYWKLSR
jgi:hypothetical protein